MKRFISLRRFFAVACAVAVALVFSQQLGRSKTLSDPCSSYAGATSRPAPSPQAAVVTKSQIVFDLCRAADRLNDMASPTPDFDSPEDMKHRARLIAQEARIIGVCPTMIITPETSRPHPPRWNRLQDHEFGCGPYNSPDPVVNVTAASKSPCTSLRFPFQNTSMHGPITKIEMRSEICDAAFQVQKATSVSWNDTPTQPSIARVLGNLSYEIFEYVGCRIRAHTSHRPAEQSADFALIEDLGCGYIPPK